MTTPGVTRRRLIVLAVILAGILVAAWVIRPGRLSVHRQSGGPPEKITLAAYAGSYGFLPFIAQEKGYFAANGLDVVINEYDFGLKTVDALIAGEADIATAADFVLASYSFDHPDLRTMASISRSLTDEIIARKDRGIFVPQDLLGKRFGVPSKTKAEFFLARFLTLNGMDFQDIEVVYLEPKEIVAAIAAGTIDAASIWEPFVSDIHRRLGDSVTSWPAQSELAFYYLLISRKAWLGEHPAATEHLLRALVQAEEYAESHPQEAQQVISKRFDYDLSFVRELWRRNDFVVELPQQVLLLMEEGARWRIKNGLTDKNDVPYLLEYVYTDGLRKVKPAAVTIIK